jgi:hypothetical protein
MFNYESLQVNKCGLMHRLGIQRQWLFVIALFFILVNSAALVLYQYYMAANFPFQDEWRYVERLHILPKIGFIHYLFDKDNNYYMPMYLLTWLAFYKFTHLNIMAMRYFGAIISGLDSVLLMLIFKKHMGRSIAISYIIIVTGIFIVCSFNYWDTYNLAISSLLIPVQLGVILITCWAAEYVESSKSSFLFSLYCVIGAVIAVGVYPNGLVVLPAIVGGLWIINRRINTALLLLTALGLVIAIIYMSGGSGAWNIVEIHKMGFEIVRKLLVSLLGLVGNGLFCPGDISSRIFTLLFGVGILSAQIIGTVYAVSLPKEKRHSFLIPIILTIYNLLVYVEIAGARFQYPYFEYYSRYSILMIAGPISVLLFAMKLERFAARGRDYAVCAIALIIFGIVAADAQSLKALPFRRASFDNVRETLLQLKGEPNPTQKRSMYLTNDILPDVYPGKLFLQENKLSLYRSGDREQSNQNNP